MIIRKNTGLLKVFQNIEKSGKAGTFCLKNFFEIANHRDGNCQHPRSLRDVLNVKYREEVLRTFLKQRNFAFPDQTRQIRTETFLLCTSMWLKVKFILLLMVVCTR